MKPSEAITYALERVEGNAELLFSEVDSIIDTNDADFHTAVLEQYGDRDLSQPTLVLGDGWFKARAQLAFNALYAATTEEFARREASESDHG